MNQFEKTSTLAKEIKQHITQNERVEGLGNLHYTLTPTCTGVQKYNYNKPIG